MTEFVKKLYEEAKNNLNFREELRHSGEESYKPTIFWGDLHKICYAAIYQGWLVARGEYNESNYKKR